MVAQITYILGQKKYFVTKLDLFRLAIVTLYGVVLAITEPKCDNRNF